MPDIKKELIGNPNRDHRFLKQNEDSLGTIRRGETRKGSAIKVLFIETIKSQERPYTTVGL